MGAKLCGYAFSGKAMTETGSIFAMWLLLIKITVRIFLFLRGDHGHFHGGSSARLAEMRGTNVNPHREGEDDFRQFDTTQNPLLSICPALRTSHLAVA